MQDQPVVRVQLVFLRHHLVESKLDLERLTYKGVLRGLIHRGGLRADIVVGGRIRQQSAIKTID